MTLCENEHYTINITHIFSVPKAITICLDQTRAGGGVRRSGEGLVVEKQPAAVGDGVDSAGRWPST